MDWVPFQLCVMRLSSDPNDRADEPYRALPRTYTPACGQLRCEQNYFELRFMIGTHRAVGFHMGLN